MHMIVKYYHNITSGYHTIVLNKACEHAPNNPAYIVTRVWHV